MSAWPAFVNTEYLQWHDRVVEGKNVTILWEFTVHTDRKIDASRPNIIIKYHEERTCIMMDMAVPSDQSISLKEFQKLSKYKDLEIEVIKMWKLKKKIIPVVIGALGMIKKGIQNFIDQIPAKPSLQEMQKTVLTSPAHILRKDFSI